MIEWHSWNNFKSNLICDWQVTLINIRSRAINTSYYVLQPICCGSLVNNMFGLSSPIFKNDVHTSLELNFRSFMQNRFGGLSWFAETNTFIWLFILTHMRRCLPLYFIHFIIIIIWYDMRLWYTLRWRGECQWKGSVDFIIHKFWYASAECCKVCFTFIC